MKLEYNNDIFPFSDFHIPNKRRRHLLLFCSPSLPLSKHIKGKEFPFHFPLLSLPLYSSFSSLLPSAAIHKVNVLFFVKVCLDFVIEGTQV